MVKSLPVPAWLLYCPKAVELANCLGRTLDTGFHVGAGRVERLNRPSGAHPHGTVGVRNAAGEYDAFDFVLLRDRLVRGDAKFVAPVPCRPTRKG